MKTPTNYFVHQKTILGILGISLDNTNRSFYYKMYSFCLATIMFISYGILEVMEAFYNFSDVDTFVSVVSYLATDLVGLIKLLILLYHRKEITDIVESFETGVFLPDLKRGGEYEVKILEKCVLISNWQAYIYQFFCMMVLLFGICGTLIERILNPNDPTKWKMPYMKFSLFPTDRSPWYELAWFYQGALRIFYCGIVSTTDTLLGAILAHISSQCLLLQNSIRRISSEDVSFSNDTLRAKLKSIIHYHWSILQMAEDFERLFSTLILCEFFATLFILCLCMYHASLTSLFSVQAAQDFSYVVAISVQVFLCCFWGNELTIQSQAIATACAETDYVGADVRFQKDLVFVIRKCQKPIVLTAGGFTDLSLKTYVWLIRASYSYYMVLRNNNN